MLERSPKRSWLDDVTGFGKITVEPLEWLPLEFICFHLRPEDRTEVFGMFPEDNALALAAAVHHAVAKNGCGWVARFNGRPAGCIGVAENHPGCWQLYSFGTDTYPRVAAFFKPKLDKMIGFARERGMHRLECKSHITHRAAHRYIGLLDLRLEGTLVKYGKDGCDYLQFARTW